MSNNLEIQILRGGEILPSEDKGSKDPQDTASTKEDLPSIVPTKEDLPTVAAEIPPLLPPASTDELIVSPVSTEIVSVGAGLKPAPTTAPLSAEIVPVSNGAIVLSEAPKVESLLALIPREENALTPIVSSELAQVEKNELIIAPKEESALVPVVEEEPRREAEVKAEEPPGEQKLTEEPKKEEPPKEEIKPRPRRPARLETALTAAALVVISTAVAWALARPKTLLFPPTREDIAQSTFAPDCKRVRFDVAGLLGERWKQTVSSCLRGSCDGLREALLTRNFSVSNWRLLEEGDQGEGCMVNAKGFVSSPECTRILGRVEGGAKTLLLQVEGECREAP